MEWLRCARDHAKRGGRGIKNTLRELRLAASHDAEGVEEVSKHYPQAEGTRPGCGAVVLIVQWPHGKNGEVSLGNELLHIL